MPKTNSWLCTYALGQLGKPYWYGCQGQISTKSLYTNQVLPTLKSLKYATYTNYTSQLNVKVHDCAGLVAGALMCDSIDSKPVRSSPIATGATSQFNGNCKTKSNSMGNFPYIPGTLVFCKGSNGVKTHVGIFVGTYVDKNGVKRDNIVVEAKNHASGVVTSSVTNSKWGAWGQLSCCTINTKKGMIFTIGADPGTSGTGGGTPVVETKNMRPYVATIPQGVNPTLDYTKINDARISAMMFFGGELFDAGHNKRTYVNPYLSSQVQKCNDNGMPYALYVNVRARTVIEADDECRALYYILAQFPPSLGVWLSLQISSSTEVNNAILEVYYKYIEKWGLGAKCGLYVTPTQLSKITWNTFKDRFYLWMIDDSVDILTLNNKLLQPELFEVPD